MSVARTVRDTKRHEQYNTIVSRAVNILETVEKSCPKNLAALKNILVPVTDIIAFIDPLEALDVLLSISGNIPVIKTKTVTKVYASLDKLTTTIWNNAMNTAKFQNRIPLLVPTNSDEHKQSIEKLKAWVKSEDGMKNRKKETWLPKLTAICTNENTQHGGIELVLENLISIGYVSKTGESKENLAYSFPSEFMMNVFRAIWENYVTRCKKDPIKTAKKKNIMESIIRDTTMDLSKVEKALMKNTNRYKKQGRRRKHKYKQRMSRSRSRGRESTKKYRRYCSRSRSISPKRKRFYTQIGSRSHHRRSRSNSLDDSEIFSQSDQSSPSRSRSRSRSPMSHRRSYQYRGSRSRSITQSPEQSRRRSYKRKGSRSRSRSLERSYKRRRRSYSDCHRRRHKRRKMHKRRPSTSTCSSSSDSSSCDSDSSTASYTNRYDQHTASHIDASMNTKEKQEQELVKLIKTTKVLKTLDPHIVRTVSIENITEIPNELKLETIPTLLLLHSMQSSKPKTMKAFKNAVKGACRFTYVTCPHEAFATFQQKKRQLKRKGQRQKKTSHQHDQVYIGSVVIKQEVKMVSKHLFEPLISDMGTTPNKLKAKKDKKYAKLAEKQQLELKKKAGKEFCESLWTQLKRKSRHHNATIMKAPTEQRRIILSNLQQWIDDITGSQSSKPINEQVSHILSKPELLNQFIKQCMLKTKISLDLIIDLLKQSKLVDEFQDGTIRVNYYIEEDPTLDDIAFNSENENLNDDEKCKVFDLHVLYNEMMRQYKGRPLGIDYEFPTEDALSSLENEVKTLYEQYIKNKDTTLIHHGH
ncbi:unnamed protein product [Owenia fusiformis]|uniref:Uncharacterized protein n=1 Tax=Owenia fusiformis TaxID=6347 RepID=A0A8J1TWD5_OWEFU|nr:unnamed protein product [Owenia fusiformis]